MPKRRPPHLIRECTRHGKTIGMCASATVRGFGLKEPTEHKNLLIIIRLQSKKRKMVPQKI